MNGRNVQAMGLPFAASLKLAGSNIQSPCPHQNAFFEHLGLVGGFLLVAWHDLKGPAASKEGRSFATTDKTQLVSKESA
jgi:hypothetical protein